jgi:hypothetical protein
MAKSAKATVAEPTVRPARLSRAEAAAKRRRDQNLLLIGAGIFFALLIALVIFLNVRSQQPVAGEDAVSSQGNIHIDPGSPSPLAYNTVPPTSGPHYGNLAAWKVYRPDEPQRYEQVVHNLEDGGVAIYYQCPEGCPEIVDRLTAIVDPLITAGRHVLLLPNNPQWTENGSQPLHQDMGAKVALTAWTRILKLDDVDEAKIRAFIEKYEGIDHHVAGQG